MESILITGASGFIGSFIVEEALKRKFGVWAGIRSTSSKRYLKNRKIHFLELESVSYATVYPLTMFLRVLTAQMLILFFV